MFAFPRRILAFVTKEVLDVLRQPRLILVLIAGPFLILLLFGLGFTGKQAPVNTILVIPDDAQLPPDMRDRQWNFGPDFPLQEVSADEESALARLQKGETDLVAVLPRETYGTLLRGEKIPVAIYLNTVDPVRSQWISFGATFFLNNINQQLAQRVAEQGQAAATSLQTFSEGALTELDTFSTALESGDLDTARDTLDQLIVETDSTSGSVEGSNSILTTVLGNAGIFLSPEDQESLSELSGRLGEFQGELRALRDELDAVDPNMDVYRERVESARSILGDFTDASDLVTSIPPDVLIAPLTLSTQNIAPFAPNYVSFYAPAVLALLAQHIALAFAALSLVRERVQGSIEMFQVSPVRPSEVLIGKTIGYTLLTFALVLVLGVLMINVLGVPLFGNPWHFFGILLLEIIASIAWGLLLSALSARESQAVQYAMLLLLASVFFSGFFLNLSGLTPQVRWIAYFLPVTYGIRNLQDVMLLGKEYHLLDAGALLLMTAILLLVTWIIFRRQSRAT